MTVASRTIVCIISAGDRGIEATPLPGGKGLPSFSAVASTVSTTACFTSSERRVLLKSLRWYSPFLEP